MISNLHGKSVVVVSYKSVQYAMIRREDGLLSSIDGGSPISDLDKIKAFANDSLEDANDLMVRSERVMKLMDASSNKYPQIAGYATKLLSGELVELKTRIAELLIFIREVETLISQSVKPVENAENVSSPFADLLQKASAALSFLNEKSPIDDAQHHANQKLDEMVMSGPAMEGIVTGCGEPNCPSCSNIFGDGTSEFLVSEEGLPPQLLQFKRFIESNGGKIQIMKDIDVADILSGSTENVTKH